MPANIYKLKDGTIVPSVTTIINQLDKPALVQWAWKLGKEGKDWREERDSAGDIGTLVHELVLDFLSGEVVELKDKDDTVKNCFRKFCDWWVEETKDYEPELITEQPLVSEELGFGGQPDIYIVNKEKLIDIKTGGGIYESHWIQLAGYGLLRKAKKYQILWLPKDGRFGCLIRKNLTKEKKIFKCLLEIYKLRREE